MSKPEQQFLELCEKIILIDSSPRNGTEEVVMFCKALCEKSAFEVTLQEGRVGSPWGAQKQFNLLARPRNSSRKNEILFQTHLDTVEPGPIAEWTQTGGNPFKATVRDGKIYGLGAADVKLDFLCKWKALSELSQEKLKNPFVLVGTYGEELDMEGAKQLVASGELRGVTKAIIGEPSEMQIVYANNGYGSCRFEILFHEEELSLIADHDEHTSLTTQEKVFYGKAAHSSTPHLGENAIHKLLQYLERLPAGVGVLTASGGTVVNTVPSQAQIEVDVGRLLPKGVQGVGQRFIKLQKELERLSREFLIYEDKNFSPPHPTLNLGVLRTEKDRIWAQVSFRFTPQIEMTKIESWWKNLEVFCQEHEIIFKKESWTPPALTPKSCDLISGAQEISKSLNLKTDLITKASATECSVYRQEGIDCMVIGPGVSIGNSHTANEYNILNQLESAVEFYRKAARKFCL